MTETISYVTGFGFNSGNRQGAFLLLDLITILPVDVLPGNQRCLYSLTAGDSRQLRPELGALWL